MAFSTLALVVALSITFDRELLDLQCARDSIRTRKCHAMRPVLTALGRSSQASHTSGKIS